ncbi:MAG: sulfatase [Planctomycetaceae bacterium]|nr:sulfatase [Planctomycetaceae bacterium]
MTKHLISRRSMLGSTAGFLSLAALNSLAAGTGSTKLPTAKHVIYLFMSGGPSHVDTFDPKPELTRLSGNPIPESFVKDVHFAMIPSSTSQPNLQGSPFKFNKYGDSGTAVSELFPQVATQVDKLAVIRSVHSKVFNHDPAVNFLNTGDSRVGRPTIGAWLSYGLGNLTEEMPAYVVMTSGVKRQPLLTSYWSSGFLPTEHQGVELRSSGSPILFLENPDGIFRDDRRRQLDLMRWMNEKRFRITRDSEILTRIQQYELAFRMQMEAPRITSLKEESKTTLEQYGVQDAKPSFAKNCLLARRMVESGVRYIQLYDMGWDSHGSLPMQHASQCAAVDKPIAALLRDLEQRGMLEDTLVIWGGEFGRTPVIQGGGTNWGRDHHPHGFTMWMAGGGIKGGTVYGSTDEFGFHAQDDKVEVHDVHATVLKTLGVDHTELTYLHQGRDFRLTDVGGRVIEDILKT